MNRRSIVAAAGLIAALGLAAGSSGCRPGPDPETLFAEAELLRLAYERGASQQAIAKYDAAAHAWSRRANHRDAARAAQRIGATHEQLGAVRASLDAYLRASSLARQASDRLLDSEILSALGSARALASGAGEALDRARGECEAALAMARQAAGTREEARALNCLGEVEYHRGNLERALDFYRQAEPLWTRTADQRGQAETLLFQGYVHSDLSDLDRARACYERALPLWLSLKDRRGEAITLVAAARLFQRRGENQEALNRFFEALTYLEAMGDVVWEASALTGVATVHLQMGDAERALTNWERALERFGGAGLENYAIDVLISLGETYLAAGDHPTALQRFERALALADTLGNRRWQANALRYIGVVHLRRRAPAEARPYLERSLAAQGSLGDRRLEAQIRADIGEAAELLGAPRQALAHYDHAERLAAEAGDRAGLARALFGRARAANALDDLDNARALVERALEVAESLRTAVGRPDLRAAYLASVHRYYELRVEVLMRLHRRSGRASLAAEAFEASERARARSLLESLAHAGVDLRAGVAADLLAREEELRQALVAAGEGTGAGRRQQFRDLEDRFTQVQAEIRSRSPRYAQLVQPRPLRLREVQSRVLDEDTVLLEYALGEQRSFLWAVAKREHASFELPPRAAIESLVQRVYERLTTRLAARRVRAVSGVVRTTDPPRDLAQADREYWQDAGQLSALLLGPVASRLAGKRLLVVLDGALQYLPFAALPLPGRDGPPVPMVTAHEIVQLPSASVLGLLRQQTAGRATPPKLVAVLADPIFQPDDPRLRGAAAPPGEGGTPDERRALRSGTLEIPRLASTREEADAIISAAGGAATFKALDFDASRATAVSRELSRFRIVHFATHGVFDNEDAARSGIILSRFNRQGQQQDGFLRLHDIYQLDLPAELVVLSACNTALGRPVEGEGLVGIVRGFMYAGAKRVVASHWMVDDDATRELMSRFYVAMLREGRSPAAALRQAQLAVRQDPRWAAPFYWAAFVLQGEWR